jgi:hypothetical protein
MLDAICEAHFLAARHLDPREWMADGRPDALSVLSEVDGLLEAVLGAVSGLAVEAEREGRP